MSCMLAVFCLLSCLLPILFASLFASISCIYAGDRNTITQSIEKHIRSLNPYRSIYRSGLGVLYSLYSGILKYDKNGKIIPGLADDYPLYSKKDHSITIKLRKNAKWSDGTPISAQDIVFSIKYTLDPKNLSGNNRLLFFIKHAKDAWSGKKPMQSIGLKILNKHTVKIYLESNAMYRNDLLAHHAFFPIPMHLVKQYGQKWQRIQATKDGVYSGAYILKAIRGNNYLLVRNKNYYDNKNVRIDNIKYVVAKSVLAGYDLFRSSAVDITHAPRFRKISYFNQNELHVGHGLRLRYLVFNTKRHAYNPEIAHAISLVIDRGIIARNIYKSHVQPAYSIVPDIVAKKIYKIQHNKKPLYQYSYSERLKIAQNIMHKLGYNKSNKMKVSINYFSNMENNILMTGIIDMLSKIYIDVKKLGSTLNTHYTKLINHKFVIGCAAWTGDDLSAYTFLRLAQTNDYHNYSQYNNVQYDINVAKGNKISNQSNKYNINAEKILADDMPIIPLLFYKDIYLVKQNIKDFSTNPIGIPLIEYMSIQHAG